MERPSLLSGRQCLTRQTFGWCPSTKRPDLTARRNGRRPVPPRPRPHRTPGGRTGRVKPTTGRRVGVTRAARPSLADVYIDKVLPLGVGAGHRVGIQNLPAGGPTPQTAEYRCRYRSRTCKLWCGIHRRGLDAAVLDKYLSITLSNTEVLSPEIRNIYKINVSLLLPSTSARLQAGGHGLIKWQSLASHHQFVTGVTYRSVTCLPAI